ncbi:Ig-like domain-containing protein [bacterium]|nr:Ig-like domain-containing protein [bacterium]
MVVPITWSVTGGVGTVSATGLFTATTAGNGTVVATSGTIHASATITVADPPPVLGSIVIAPTSANLLTGGTRQFTATGYDTKGNIMAVPITWSVTGGIGTVSATGLFTATTAGNGTVVASSGGISANVPVTVADLPPVLGSIVIAPTITNLFTGATKQFTATSYDTKGAVMVVPITWSVTGGIGIISQTGLFTATTAGNGTVVASSGDITTTFLFTVTAPPPVLGSIVISPASADVLTGGTAQFTATAYDTTGAVMVVPITWSVTGGIGSIDQNGLFTAMTAGNGSAVASSGEISAAAPVTVSDPPPVLGSIVISPASANLLTDETAQFTATGYDTKGAVMAVPITWSVTGGIGTVSTTGLFTATTAGNGSVVASSGGISANVPVSVSVPPPVLGSIVISPASADVLINWTVQFTATAYDITGAVMAAPISWSVTGGIGSVDQSGLFTATTAGNGSVVASSGGISANVPVTVSVPPPVLGSIVISPASASTFTNGTVRFTTTSYDSKGALMAVPISWSVTGGIGSIDQNGLFTATAAGNGFVIASSGGISANVPVTVSVPPPVLGSIVISPETENVLTGGTAQFTATGYDTKGTVMVVPITWSVTGGVGTISQDGLFMATIAGNGAVIASSGEISANVPVTVIDPPPLLTSIAIYPASTTLFTGETIRFTATAYDAKSKTMTAGISWSVEGNIGTISADGDFIATNTGTGFVIASAGEITHRVSVTVKKKEKVITSLVISPGNGSVTVGKSIHFSATAYDADGLIVNTAIGWSVEGSVGTINNNGNFTATTYGSGNVVASAGSISAKALVTVIQESKPISSIVISPGNSSVTVGNSIYFSATAYDADGTVIIAGISWSVEGSVGTINNNGNFTATTPGSGQIIASIGGISAKASIIVINESKPKSGITSLVITPGEGSVTTGGSLRFSARAYDGDGNIVAASVSWSVSGGIGGIDQNGLFTATTEGSGSIIASSGSVTAVASVTVSAPLPALGAIAITPGSASVLTGETVQFSATSFDTNNSIMQTSISWSVTGNIGTIDQNGLFTATTAGSGSVIASSGTVTAEVPVTVANPAPALASITITPASADILSGETVQFTATALDADGTAMEAEISWSVSGDIGTIDRNGLFTSTSPGSGTVIASSGSVTAEVPVTVANPAPVLTSITITPASADILSGETVQFTATALDADGTAMEAEISWSVAGDIGTIDRNGLFTATTPGSGSVIASSDSVTVEVPVSVVKPAPVLASITITPASADILTGETVQFTATAFDADSTAMEAEISWSVAGDIGTIDENGLFTATTAGSGSVIASSGAVTAEVPVTVTTPGPIVKTLVIIPNMSDIVIEQTMQFTAWAYDTDGNIINGSINWSVEGGIGTISDGGEFNALTVGNGYVVASFGGVSVKAPVTVKPKPAPEPEYEVYQFPVKENETLLIFGFQYPYKFLNGMKLHFPEGSLADDIMITMKLPSYAEVNKEQEEVAFGGTIISAVSFEVSSNGKEFSTYYFKTPIDVTIPYKKEVLDELGIEPADLSLFFVNPEGDLILEGIYNILIDEQAQVITGKVAHFSDIAVAPKPTGQEAIRHLSNLLGDFDGDMSIDFADYTQFVAYWNAGNMKGDIVGKPEQYSMAGYPPWSNEIYPYTPDGITDYEDHTVFAMMYNWYNSVISSYADKPIVVSKRIPTDSVSGLSWKDKDYQVGDTFTVSFNPGRVEGFLSSEINLTYSDEILKITNVTTGSAFERDDVKLPVLYKTDRNNLTASAVVLGSTSRGITIAGENLLEIEFEVIRDGAFTIDLAGIEMRDYLNNHLAAAIDNRSIAGKIGSSGETLPLSFGLSQNFPNPFNMSTTIAYSVDKPGNVRIVIYNTLGQLVRTLVDDSREAGRYSAIWNGTDDAGIEVTTGVYFVRMIQNNRSDTRSMLMVK